MMSYVVWKAVGPGQDGEDLALLLFLRIGIQ